MGGALLHTIPLCYSCFQFRPLLTGRTAEHSTNRTFPPTAPVLEASFDFDWGSDDFKFTSVCVLGGELTDLWVCDVLDCVSAQFQEASSSQNKTDADIETEQLDLDLVKTPVTFNYCHKSVQAFNHLFSLFKVSLGSLVC